MADKHLQRGHSETGVRPAQGTCFTPREIVAICGEGGDLGLGFYTKKAFFLGP